MNFRLYFVIQNKGIKPLIKREIIYDRKWKLICQTLILNNDYVFVGQSFIDVDCNTHDT